MQLLRDSLLLFCVTFSIQCTAWELHKDADQVKIYQRVNAQQQFEVKAVTVVKARLKSLMNLLDDTAAAPLWIDRCRKVDLLDWFGGRERLVHTYFSSPWPIKDRDMVTFSSTEVSDDGQALTIEVIDRSKQHQLLPHYVRMRDVTGRWTVKQLKNNQVEISYQGSGNAGGSIPNWLSNRLMLSSTHKTFVNMRKRIVLPEYQ